MLEEPEAVVSWGTLVVCSVANGEANDVAMLCGVVAVAIASLADVSVSPMVEESAESVVIDSELVVDSPVAI